MDAEQEYQLGAISFKAGNAKEGAEHLRNAAFAGHAEAQNQLARVYFAQVKTREGTLLPKDTDKALTALRIAARNGNTMAAAMLAQQAE